MLFRSHSKDFLYELVGGWQWWFPRCKHAYTACFFVFIVSHWDSLISCITVGCVVPQTALLIHHTFCIEAKPSNVQMQISVCHILSVYLWHLSFPPTIILPSPLFRTQGCSIIASFLPHGPISTGVTARLTSVITQLVILLL